MLKLTFFFKNILLHDNCIWLKISHTKLIYLIINLN